MKHLTELQLDQIATLFAHKSSIIYPDFDEQNITWDRYLEGVMYASFLHGAKYYKEMILKQEDYQYNLKQEFIPKEYDKNISNEYPDTLTVKQVSNLMKLSVSRIYVLHSLKFIPSHKIGSRVIFYRDEIMKLIENGFKVTMQDEVNARHKMQEDKKNKS